MFKNLPKTGSSKHPWLTANAKLGTSFLGQQKNQAIFKFQNMPAPGHVPTPLVSGLKITFFPKNERTNEERKSSFDCAHGRKERFAQKAWGANIERGVPEGTASSNSVEFFSISSISRIRMHKAKETMIFAL